MNGRARQLTSVITTAFKTNSMRVTQFKIGDFCQKYMGAHRAKSQGLLMLNAKSLSQHRAIQKVQNLPSSTAVPFSFGRISITKINV